MHLKGSYSGRSFSIGSDGSVQFSKTLYFEPDTPYETQIDLYMCDDFPHIGDPWKFDDESAHDELTVNFSKQLVCNGVSNAGKLVDEAADLAAQNMEVWVVNATYKIPDGINIGGGGTPVEPTPISPDPFPSGSDTPSAIYLPDDFQIGGAPWEKYPQIDVNYTETDSSLQAAYKTITFGDSDKGHAYVSFILNSPTARWDQDSDGGRYMLPVVNPVGEAYDFKNTSFIASETITWSSRKISSGINTTSFANDKEIKTALGHELPPHSVKVNPIKMSRKIYNTVLDTSKINSLLEDYVEKYPSATQAQLSSIYTQYFKSPRLQIPYYDYELQIDYNPEGWLTWFEEVGTKAEFDYKDVKEIESCFKVSVASGFNGQLSTFYTGIVGLREWNDLDALYNKSSIPKELAESGYVQNATAERLEKVYYDNSQADVPVESPANIITSSELILYSSFVGFTSLRARSISGMIQNDVLSGNWPSKLLYF